MLTFFVISSLWIMGNDAAQDRPQVCDRLSEIMEETIVIENATDDPPHEMTFHFEEPGYVIFHICPSGGSCNSDGMRVEAGVVFSGYPDQNNDRVPDLFECAYFVSE